jgi:CRISPR-associated protein Cas1
MSRAPRRLARPLDGVALFQDATSVAGLTEGWKRVWANQGAAGGDGVRLQQFASGAADRLVQLSRSLREGSYRPGPIRLVEIPKKSGGRRRLSIPPIACRVAQSAVALRLAPELDREFEEASFGYRQGRGVADAVRRVETLRRAGYVWTVDADIDDFFDTIPIDRLVDRLTRSITESPLVELIARWLEHGAERGRGIAQGSPLSPLLANLYLDDLDEALDRDGLRLVRYADDFVVLAKDRPAAEAGLDRVQAILARHGLALDRDKTRIRGYDDGLRFLGTVFVRGWAMASPEPDGEAARPGSIEALLTQIARQDEAAERRAAEAAEAETAIRAAGLDRGLRLLHIGEPGRRLALRNLSFAVHEAAERRGPDGDGELVAIHPSRIDRIELGPRCEADFEALKHAVSSGIPVALLDGHGSTLGQLAPVLAPRAGRHLAQARHALDPGKRLDLARILVAGRIANQRAALRRVNHRRGLAGVDDAASRLGHILRKVPTAGSVEMAMGFEGEATAVYWPAWGSLLLNGFAFGPRRRRAAADPVNIALDLLSGQLARDVGAILLSVGLHPGFGMLHTTSDGRDACVYDLMEEFRAALVESVVLTAINGGRVTLDMVQHLPDGACRLSRAAVSALIRAYEERCEGAVTSPRSGRRVAWRRLMREQAEAYAAHVEDRQQYRAHVLDH